MTCLDVIDRRIPIERFRESADALTDLLRELGDGELDLSEAPDEWSVIRTWKKPE